LPPTPAEGLAATLDELLRRRRSIRRFRLRPVPLERLSALLATVAGRAGRPAHASAGDLYPVRAYVYVKPGRLAGLASGSFLYDPAEGPRPLGPERRLLGSAFGRPQNRAIFDEAAFAILLVAQMPAIEAAYTDRALHFATLEAGLITQVLELAAPTLGLGLCQIGSIDEAAAAALLGLSGAERLLHVIVGGEPDDTSLAAAAPDVTEEGRLARLFDRVAQLSDDEAGAVLAGHGVVG
jgi:SagB-type dehydrogenase family enzyme